MQYSRARIQGERTIRLNLGRSPAGGGGPGDGEHVVREGFAENEVGGRGFWLRGRGLGDGEFRGLCGESR